MALDILRGRGSREAGIVQPLAIGEMDGEIFSCPVCARPLAHGTHRCPGCGTRLVLGVPAARASLFVGAGVAAGLFAGAVAVSVFVAISRPQAIAAPAPVPVVVPSVAAIPPATTPIPVRPPEFAVPALARSSLGQAVTLHVRLSTAGSSLAVFLAADDLDASAVARVIRSIASDAANGSALAPRVGAWDEAGELSADLATFYGVVRETARDGLQASVRNEPAYRAAGEAMLAVLAGLPAIDAETRTLADDAGVDVPPLSADPAAVSP